MLPDGGEQPEMQNVVNALQQLLLFQRPEVSGKMLRGSFGNFAKFPEFLSETFQAVNMRIAALSRTEAFHKWVREVT